MSRHLRSDNEECVRAISDWYETSVRKAVTVISDKDLKSAYARWKSQRRNRPLPPEPTLLAALQKDKDAMSERFVFVFARSVLEDLSKRANAVLEEEQRLRNDRDITCLDLTGGTIPAVAHIAGA
jgi:hypothetical protein